MTRMNYKNIRHKIKYLLNFRTNFSELRGTYRIFTVNKKVESFQEKLVIRLSLSWLQISLHGTNFMAHTLRIEITP